MPSLQTVGRLMTRKSFPFMLENPYCSASSLRPPARIFMSTLEDCLDLKVIIQREGGAYPILAQGEGTQLLCGVVLATKGASLPKLSRTASTSTAASTTPRKRGFGLSTPLPNRPIDRTLPATLGGNMATYVWTINEAAYPNRKSLDIRKGERVGIAFTISTKMGHPMHLHGHDFQVVEIDGEKNIRGLRDNAFRSTTFENDRCL